MSESWDDEEGQQDGGKSHNAERTVFIIAELRSELIAHKLRTGRDGDDLAFGRSATEPFTPSTIRRRALDAWDELDPVTLQEARHTWVSMSIAAGVNPHTLMVAAGHGSYRMTMEHYGKVMPGALNEAADQLHQYLAVLPWEVVNAADWGLVSDCAVAARSVVVLEPVWQGLGAGC